jgi:hypothetical protein
MQANKKYAGKNSGLSFRKRTTPIDRSPLIDEF